MKSEEQIRNDWSNVDVIHENPTLKDLQIHSQKAKEYLIDCVCAECGVEREEIFSKRRKSRLVHARWLYWYAYRYMTNESFDEIAKSNKKYGHDFDSRSITGGVNKMAYMISREQHWASRWAALRRTIKLRDDEQKTLFTQKITIYIPKELKNKVEIEIKEK